MKTLLRAAALIAALLGVNIYANYNSNLSEPYSDDVAYEYPLED